MSNEAAWISEASAPMKVGPAPMYTPGPDEIVIKIRAVAVNPMEAFIQKTGLMLDGFPAIIGADGAGEVYAIGSDVKDFSRGDHVMALFAGVPAYPYPKVDYRSVCYQRYAVTKARVAVKLSPAVAFTDAAVLPLSISSAADALFSVHGMELPWPEATQHPEPRGKAVVVWAGGSSIGMSAIQLLVSAGYTVVATAGAKNHGACKLAGASDVFDHTSPTVVEDIVRKLSGTDVAGVFNALIREDPMQKSFSLHCKLGLESKVGTMQVPGLPTADEVPSGVTTGAAYGSFAVTSKLGAFIWSKWLPSVLESKTLKFLPEPIVCGKGLDQIQGAIDRYNEGVSGQKIVVEMD